MGSCSECSQPRNLCTRPSRYCTEFSVKMLAEDFEEYSILPCCYYTRIKFLCPSKIMKAVEAFRITAGDTIKFSYDEDEDIFNVSVIVGIDQPKYWFGFPECHNLPADCEEAFRSTFFMEATVFSQAEMNRLVTRYREYMSSQHYHNNAPNFIIHRLVSSEYACWVVPFEAIKSNVVLKRKGDCIYAYNQYSVQGTYKIRDDGTIIFREHWADLRVDNNILPGDLFIARVVANRSYIGLDIHII
nr:uncharacterized protein LOC127309420 isoform X4 [Lolium perenne]